MKDVTVDPGEIDSDRSHTVAIFPGAFRPPHEAHLAAIVELAGRRDVGEVIVIISGRARHLPGTPYVLPPQVARSVLELYLAHLHNVRIEIAEHTAVDRAREYVARAAPGARLLLCLGEADRDEGDRRFDARLDAPPGVRVDIVSASTRHLPVRATDLRRALAEGVAGRATFMNLLPRTLTDLDRDRVWRICQAGLVSVGEWTAGKLREHLARSGIGVPTSLTPVNADRLDPAFHITMPDNSRLVGKYSGDTVEEGSFGDACRLKPRRRLRVEARALALVARLKSDTVIDVPSVVSFDRRSSSLVLTDVVPGGSTLASLVRSGRADSALAERLGRWLATLHTRFRDAAPLWGDLDADRAHWRRMLDLQTTIERSDDLDATLRARLEAARIASMDAARQGLSHLAFEPQHVRTDGWSVGVVHFERACGCADPALDLATMLGVCRWIVLREPGLAALADEVGRALTCGYLAVSPNDTMFTARASLLGAAVLLARSEAQEDPVLRARAIDSARRVSTETASSL